MGKNIAKQRNKSTGSASPKPASKKKDIREIELDKIDIGELCLRKNPEEDLEQLAKSIESLGLIHYPVVRQKPDGRYELVCGHRRYLAHKHNNEKTILCRVMYVDPLDSIYIAIAENMKGIRKSANPVRMAASLQELKKRTGQSEAEIADKIGCQQSTVAELTGLTRLPNYILEKIDNDPKRRFKYSHAVEISKLQENRFYREVEVNALLNKTTTVGVSSAELRKLVQLINEGHYDRLPDSIRTLLFSNQYMTAAMARLFLYPEEFIGCDGQEGEVLRRMATELDKKEREEFINTAVKNKSSLDQAKTEFTKLLRRRAAKLAREDQEPPQSGSDAQALYSELSNLALTLEQQYYQSSSLMESKSKEADKLCKVADKIIGHLQFIVGKIKQTRKGLNESKK